MAKVLPFLLFISCPAPGSVCSSAPPNVHSTKHGAGRQRNHWQGGKGIISVSGKLQDHRLPLYSLCGIQLEELMKEWNSGVRKTSFNEMDQSTPL